MAAARRATERAKPIPVHQAEKAERALRRIFGRNLLLFRERAELSQQALGDRAMVSPNYISRAELGARDPAGARSANVTLDVVARLAACLDVTPAALLTDTH